MVPLEVVGSSRSADRPNPAATINVRQFMLIAQELVTVRKSVFGASRGSFDRERDHIMAALDMLFARF